MHVTQNGYSIWVVYVVHFLQCIFSIASSSVSDKTVSLKILNSTVEGNFSNIALRLNDIDGDPMEPTMMLPKMRVKRQSGGGKYTDAAKMPQVKILRLILQMIRNTWAPVYVGGVHPLHHEVPKPIVQLYKQKIVEFFFPDVGAEHKKT